MRGMGDGQAATISKLQFDVQALDIDLVKVREVAQNVQRELREAQGGIASFEQQLAQKEKARQELEHSCAKLRGSVEIAERLKKEAIEIQHRLEEEKNQLEEELRGSNHRYAILNAEKQLIEKKLARLEKENEEHVGNADERYVRLESRHKELQAQFDEASEERRKLEIELQGIKEQLETVSEQKKALEVKKDLLEKEKQGLDELNAQLSSEVGSLKAKQEERSRPVKQEPVADNGRNSEKLLRDELAKEREARQKAEKERQEAVREEREAKVLVGEIVKGPYNVSVRCSRGVSFYLGCFGQQKDFEKAMPVFEELIKRILYTATPILRLNES